MNLRSRLLQMYGVPAAQARPPAARAAVSAPAMPAMPAMPGLPAGLPPAVMAALAGTLGGGAAAGAGEGTDFKSKLNQAPVVPRYLEHRSGPTPCEFWGRFPP